MKNALKILPNLGLSLLVGCSTPQISPPQDSLSPQEPAKEYSVPFNADNIVELRKCLEETVPQADLFLSERLHLYLASLVPITQEEIQALLNEKVRIKRYWGDKRVKAVEVNSADNYTPIESHRGQVEKLLNLMIDDGLIKEDLYFREKNGNSYRLNDPSWKKYGAGYSLRPSIFESILRTAAWDSGNYREIPPTEIVSTEEGPKPFEEVVNRVYKELELYKMPKDSLMATDLDPQVVRNLKDSKVEYLSHGVVTYGLYEENHPDGATQQRMQNLYKIVRDELALEIATAHPRPRHLGHYLETLARTAETFSIDITKDRPLIEQAIKLTTTILLLRNDTTPEVPGLFGIIESYTHALIGVEKAYELLQ